ncbi:hypothetical protein DM860_003441 [Cuscuta australis]|uniref:Uncharacterized protein n=1 Tax=Cuscuta australis TaxID=267555 RepID=A0A328DFV9_9ASTE|nr:hypothetical protein DM860_003441 [Cuscuta australis]
MQGQGFVTLPWISYRGGAKQRADVRICRGHYTSPLSSYVAKDFTVNRVTLHSGKFFFGKVRPSLSFKISEPCTCFYGIEKANLEDHDSWPRFILIVDQYVDNYLTQGRKTKLDILSSPLNVWIVLKANKWRIKEDEARKYFQQLINDIGNASHFDKVQFVWRHGVVVVSNAYPRVMNTVLDLRPSVCINVVVFIVTKNDPRQRGRHILLLGRG